MSTAAVLIDVRRFRRTSIIVGVIGLLGMAVGFFVSSDQFFRSYLWAFLFWLSIGLGCLALLMLYHLLGGSWGFSIRRIIESGTRTLPLMALLFIPVLLGIGHLYAWANPEFVAESGALQQKRLYLNTPFWIARAVLYFAIWILYAHRLNALSMTQDQTGDLSIPRRFERLSAPGLIVYAFTLTFAVFDWAMSLEPEWFSTIYGMSWMVSQALLALSFAIIVAGLIFKRASKDLGNLLLAFVMLWAYLSFSQFLIIWSGNLPEEIPWYLSRLRNGWQWVAAALLVFHFFMPFFLLLSRFLKQRVRTLVAIAALIFVMRIVDVFWVVTPAFYGQRFSVHWLDLFALVGLGGIWLAVYVTALGSAPLVPLSDPNIAPHKTI
jgi:hypothetical protein